MKVLVTQPHGKEHLVEAFKAIGVELLDPKKHYRKPDLIIPTVDEELPTLAHLKPLFADNGVTIAISSEFTVNMCRDKAEFSRFLSRHGFGKPTTGQMEAIFKPRFGKGSRGQIKVDRSYIVQEIIDWPEYSIDYYKNGDRLSIIPRKRLNVVNGESQEAEIVLDPVLINDAKRLGEELYLEYHNVMQCFYNGKEIKWIEVNPRYGGGSWLTFDKFNSPAHLVNSLREKV